MNKILFVNSSLTSGGSEKVMTLLANEYVKRKNDVKMVLLYNYGYDTYELDSRIGLYRFKYEHKIRIIKKFRQLKNLRKIIKNGEFDYVVSFMQSINILTLLATIGLKTKVIVSERCNPQARKNVIKNLLASLLYKNKAYKVVFQTNMVKEMFGKKIQQKSIVIPNPVDENIIEMFEGKREKKIVAVGRLTVQKNFKMLISAFSKISTKYNDYILEIYGEGPLKKELEQNIKEYNMQDRIFLKGYTKDVNKKMLKARVYVSVSDYEGISNTMIEALAMGIPTICTDCPVGGAKLMINNEVNGILIQVGDESALIKFIEKLLNDEEYCKKLSYNAIKIRNEYSIERITNLWEKIII